MRLPIPRDEFLMKYLLFTGIVFPLNSEKNKWFN